MQCMHYIVPIDTAPVEPSSGGGGGGGGGHPENHYQ